MKKLIFMLLLAAPMISLAQFSEYDFDIKKATVVDEKITYTLIDTVENVDKNKLQSLLLEWVALKFRSATNVIKLNDKEAGKIIVKGLSSENYSVRVLGTEGLYPYNQNFTIDFTVKDGRYRVIMTDFVINIAATYSRYGSSAAQENAAETYLDNIPKIYDWEKLKNTEKKLLNINKNVVANTYSSAKSTLQSIKDFIRKNMNSATKKDEF